MREIGAAPFIAKIRHYLEENESNMDRLGSEYGIPGERVSECLRSDTFLEHVILQKNTKFNF